MSTRILLARHGETADNRARIFQGQGGRGLNPRGVAQAGRLAERLATKGIAAVVTSDLERARETAARVAGACGLEASVDAGLREVDVGTWTGRSYEDVAALYPEEWATWSHGRDVRRGGGETYAELAERVDQALLRIAAAHEGSTVVVVSHGGAIKSWVARILGLPPEGMRVLGGVGNAGLVDVERTSGRYVLHAWNDTAHLEGLVVDDTSD